MKRKDKRGQQMRSWPQKNAQKSDQHPSRVIYVAPFAIVLSIFIVAILVGRYESGKDLKSATEMPVETIPLTLETLPAKIQQGEPLMLTLQGATSSVDKITFNGRELGLFTYQGKPSALAGVDLNLPSGSYTAKAYLNDGTTLSKKIVIAARYRKVEDLGIPEKLGGDTRESQQALSSTLETESLVLKNLASTSTVMWHEPFTFPVPNPVITDPYGYSRQTGEFTIPHLGTDFKAKVGTPITSMNRGVVRLVREFRNFGKTVVVDHGEGLMTLYLHLSKFSVKQGQIVEKGQLLGLSGETGYVSGPHLHLSVKVDKASIDPMKFMALFASPTASSSQH